MPLPRVAVELELAGQAPEGVAVGPPGEEAELRTAVAPPAAATTLAGAVAMGERLQAVAVVLVATGGLGGRMVVGVGATGLEEAVVAMAPYPREDTVTVVKEDTR